MKGKFLLKKGIIIGIICLCIGICFSPTILAKEISIKENWDRYLKNNQISEIKPDIQIYAKKLLLSPYKIDIYQMTIGDAKKLIYSQLAKIVPSMRLQQINEIKSKIMTSFTLLENLGINSDMSIFQTINIIEKKGITIDVDDKMYLNLFCRMNIIGDGGWLVPYFRFFKVIYGMYSFVHPLDPYYFPNSSPLEIRGLFGTQRLAFHHGEIPFCDGNVFFFIGEWGNIEQYDPGYWVGNVVDGFALVSFSTIPFVNSEPAFSGE